MLDESDDIKVQELEPVTTPALVGICLAAGVFLVGVLAVTCFCRRGRQHEYGNHTFLGGGGGKKYKMGPEKPLAFHHKKPSAVKSPGGNTHYLKKSPSPTGGKSPPGVCSAVTSPTNPEQRSPVTEGGPAEGKNGLPATCQIENERPLTPSKEELDTNEKETQHNGRDLGQIFFKLRYKGDKSALVVSLVKCRDLPAKDSNTGSSDPYIKLQLLPEKQHKVKTRVLRKTRNPVYDEDFTFYGINQNQLQGITLHFVVLSFDRYSRDDIIGEVFYSLSAVEAVQLENQQVSLCRDIQPRSLKIRLQARGELLVSLCWQPAANRLTVVVLKARNLPKMDVTGLADPYVKMYLLYNGQRIAKKKTHVKKRTLNPVFNESFVFDIPPGTEGLENVSLEFLLLDWDRVTKNEVIGRLELGGSKDNGGAVHHWHEVCTSPRRQIAEWHKLRE